MEKPNSTPEANAGRAMSRRGFLQYSAGAVACASWLGGCGGSAALTAPSIAPTDYAVATHWLAQPVVRNQAVDVFYLYPTAWRKANTSDPNICAVDNTSMIAGARSAFARQATAFDPVANIFAPFYRQADATYTLSLPEAEREKVIAAEPSVDCLAAFDYYIQNLNQGRPFILAGHSQGSNVLLNILADYMRDYPQVYQRMIAAYVIGYSVTGDYLAKNPHLKFAQGADDTGVIISYNTQAPDLPAGSNPVVLPGALVINPITWTRSAALADKPLGLGSFMPAPVTGTLTPVPQYADAQVDAAKGALLTTADPTGLTLGFGPGVYHSYDYPFYYFNLRANAANRIAKF